MNNKTIILIAICIILFGGCREDNGELAPPESKLEGINGAWELETIQMTDELQPRSNAVDVTEYMLGSDPAWVTFNNSDFTFSLDQGDSRIFLPESGDWQFDDDLYPTMVILDHQLGTDSTILQRTVRPSDPILSIKYIRPSEDCNRFAGLKGTTGYIYSFKRQ